MKRLTYLTAATAALGLAALTGGCNAHRSDPQSDATKLATHAASNAATNHGSNRSAATIDRQGASQPAQIRSPMAQPHPSASTGECDSDDVPVEGLLHAMRTGHHATFDRVVFEFCGSRVPAHQLRYVNEIVHDPSGLPLPLHGPAFVRVVFDGGTTTTAPIAPDPTTAPRYTGPSRLTPNHALLKEVAIAGDFERVLSFGIGIEHATGLHVQTLTAPARLVVDFWSTTPRTLLWPVSTVCKARELQHAVDQGHQPWLLSPRWVTTVYAQQVMGWAHPSVRRVGHAVYEVSLPTTNKTATLTLVQPVRRGLGGVWVVADVAR
jgi:hypothetical protein